MTRGPHRFVRPAERWDRRPEKAGTLAPRQVVQHAAPWLPAGRHRRQHPLHEPAPRLTVGPAADPPPDDGVAKGPLGRVVRRLDALDPREGPQAIPEPQKLGTGRRRL